MAQFIPVVGLSCRKRFDLQNFPVWFWAGSETIGTRDLAARLLAKPSVRYDYWAIAYYNVRTEGSRPQVRKFDQNKLYTTILKF